MWKCGSVRTVAGFTALLVVIVGSTVAVTSTVASAAPTVCGGVVFQDYDADGERNEDYSSVNDAEGSNRTRYDSELDPGVAGVEVAVTTADGSALTATTDADGRWSVTVDHGDFPLRARFDALPPGFVSGPAGPDSATTVQFIQTATDCAGPHDGDGPIGNLGVLDPHSYCQASPDLYASCFLYGNIANHDNEPAVVRLADGTQDNNAESDWATPGYTITATLGEVGTVWGQGIDGTTGDVYLGSMVKRHTRLAGNPTTIYRQTAAGSVTPWFTTDPSAVDPHTASADAAALGLGDPLDGWTYDFGAFDEVGKSGLGDVEVSPDGNTVFTVDLGRRELVSIPIRSDGTPGTATRTAITAAALGVSTDCPESDVRPFGLGFDEAGVLHVGTICSAESTVPDPFVPIRSAGPVLGNPSALAGWVHAFDDSASSFSTVADVPVPTTSRGGSIGSGTDFSHLAQWRPWVNRMPYAPANLPSFGNTYPQPMVSDVAFDGDDLIVGLMDRWAHQTGPDSFYEDWSNPVQPNAGFLSEQPVSSGDIVRGTWNGAAYDFPAADADGRDFTYDGDNYLTTHAEITIGAVVQIPGRPYVIANAFDPNAAADTWRSGGLVWLDNTGGEHVNGVRLYNGRSAGIDFGTFEKAAGIGDLEADCGRAPIQIGNRVWFDADGDGLQGPAEQGLDGVIVELMDAAGSVIDTTTTAADGNYLFGGIDSGADHSIRLAAANYDDGAVFAPGGVHVGRGAPTTADVGTDDALDSDATLVDGLPSIPVNVSASDHTFDFGMSPALELGNLIWFDTDNDGVRDPGESAAPGVTVHLLDADGELLDTRTTDADGHYGFDDIGPGTYLIELPSSNFANGGPLAGWHPSTGTGVGTDADDDVDDNSDGIATDGSFGAAVRSGPVTVAVGTEPTDEVDESPPAIPDLNSNLTVDFGFYTASLGNLVWFDDDNDGIRDPAEVAAPGVIVRLLDDSDEPVLDADGEPMELTTDDDGHYEFTGLREGTYVVEVVETNFDPDGPLEGFASSTGNDVDGGAPDPDDNNDDDDNGDAVDGGAIRSRPIVLAAIGEPDGSGNPTVDFGLVTTAGLGDRVWFDADRDGVQDAGELSVPDVTVTVYRTSSGEEAGTGVTDDDGLWLVDGLSPGDYHVVFSVPDGFDPDGEVWTVQNQGDDGADSDPDTSGRTAVITLDPGEVDRTVDAGIIPSAPDALAFTGPGQLTLLLSAGVMSVVAGGLLLQLTARRRRLTD